MQVTTDYLDAFAVGPAGHVEIPLNGWEMFAGAGTINIDDPEDHKLIVVHWDEWPSWREAIAAAATDKRWTFVTVMKDGATVGAVGYEFPGLVRLDDLRSWYRNRLGLADDKAPEAA